MTIEQMIQAREQLHRVNGLSGIALCGIVLIAAALCALACWKNRRHDLVELAAAITAIVALMAMLCLPFAAYEFFTAGVQARAEVANYNQVELKQ